MADRLIPMTEVAERLGGVSIRTAKRRIEEAGINPPRPGRAFMLTEADLAAVIEASRCRSSSSLQASARATLTTSRAPRSADETLRSLRRRETSRLLADLRKSSNAKSRKVVSLDLEKP
jgi:hypothetical protein